MIGKKKTLLIKFIKRYKQVVSNDKPISLFPICSKIFEKFEKIYFLRKTLRRKTCYLSISVVFVLVILAFIAPHKTRLYLGLF